MFEKFLSCRLFVRVERFQKCEFELLKCENIMRFFSIEYIFRLKLFAASSMCVLVRLFFEGRIMSFWSSFKFLHTHCENRGWRERNFHLFYSLTKLTSILFLPFYSNIIKAVRSGEEEKQFVTVYHSAEKQENFGVWAMCVRHWRKKQKEIEETRLLILHEMDSKLYNV